MINGWIGALAVVCNLGSDPAQARAEGEERAAKSQYVCPPCGCVADDKVFDAPGTCPACGMILRPRSSESARRRNVAIVIYEGVELLDFAGPGEVFQVAARLAGGGKAAPFHVFTVAPRSGPVRSLEFVTVVPQHDITDCPDPDILVIPGGATDALLESEPFMDWLKAKAASAEILFSVCNGAGVLGRAGLLDGHEVTTHWGSIEGLRRRTPRATVLENRRFVDSGRVVTSAGVSAGIDGALHVVQRLLGAAAASAVARYMEYTYWNPEGQASPHSRYPDDEGVPTTQPAGG